MSDEELGRELAALMPNARGINGKCPCGSGQYAYNLYDTKKEFVLYCCITCEKPRRTALEKGGKTLTEGG